MFTEQEIRIAAERIYRDMPATAQYNWPLLSERMGCQAWVKHENHSPTGAFKIRGGITYVDWFMREYPQSNGIITATRGNHGQAQARAAKAAGLQIVVIVPKGNGQEKNASIRAMGAELIVHGNDFDEAKQEAMRLAKLRNLYFVPSWHRELVRGVSTYAMELFDAAALDALYVPIGCGSGICACIAARDAMRISTEIIGVVSKNANAAKLSFDRKKIIETKTAHTFADGCAVRVPVPESFEYYSKGASRIIEVEEDDIAEAVRILWQDTHNLTEGAGAMALAGLMKEKDIMAGKNIGLILSGGNIDQHHAAQILSGNTPQ